MREKIKKILPWSLLLLAGLAAYAPTFRGGFVWDDRTVVADNPFIKGWDRTMTAFTPDYWRHFHPVQGARYRPLRNVSFTLDYTFGRLDPLVYKLTNFGLHFAAAALLFLFARRLFGAELPAAATGCVFMAWPRLMENVAWVRNRGEIMAAICLLWGLLLIHDRDARLELKLAGLLLLGLLSIESALVIPLVWGLYLALFGGEEPLKALKLLYPALGLLAAYAAFMFYLAGGLPSAGGGALDWLKAWGGYIWLSVMPYGVNPVRALPGLPALAAIATAAAVVWALRKDRIALFLAAWIPLSLTAAALPFRGRPMADHAAYYACIAAALLLVYLVKNYARAKIGLAIFVILNIIIIAHNGKVYAEERALWEYAFTRAPADGTVLLNLGRVYMASGEPEKAAPFLKKATADGSSGAYAYNDLGLAAQQEGKTDEALSYFGMAIQMDPSFYGGYLNRGGVRYMRGLHEEARADWEAAMALAPNRPEVYNNLGLYYAGLGKLAEAKDYFYEAVVIDPEFAEARENLVVVHRKLGQDQMAREELYRLSKIKARNAASREIKAD